MADEHSKPETLKNEHGEAHAHEQHHPDWKTYRWVALVLTVVTIVEVWIYYTPFTENRLFVPSLLTMSAFKFVVVVMFYMHLKYDAKIFRALFIGPLLVAIITLMALMFLFSQLKLNM
ncbi:MAG: cytochrome C oxidase subunit IV family protein [Gemmatimonadaceae bacterium]